MLGAQKMKTPAFSRATAVGGQTPLVHGGGESSKKSKRAIADYVGGEEWQLSVSEGEVVDVVKEEDDGWAECMTRNGDLGMLPMSYLEDCAGDGEEAAVRVANTCGSREAARGGVRAPRRRSECRDAGDCESD